MSYIYNDSNNAYTQVWNNIFTYVPQGNADDGFNWAATPSLPVWPQAPSDYFTWYAETGSTYEPFPNSTKSVTTPNDTLLYDTKQENSLVLPGSSSPPKYGMRFYSDKVLIDKDMFSTDQSSGTMQWEETYPGRAWTANALFLKLSNTSSWPADDVYLLLTFDTNEETETIDGNVYWKFSYGNQAEAVCLTDTCDILTPNGYVNVKDLSVGDKVTTPEGKNVKITKVMNPTTHYSMGKAYPHFIPKNSLGENKPVKDTFISKNHAYKSGDEWLCGQFNIEHNATNWDKEFVTYYNIMTEDYPKHTLVVNGVEMESWGGFERNKPETHGKYIRLHGVLHNLFKLRREKLGFK